MRTGLTKQEKTTEIYFDEKDPTIFIRIHNTDLKNRLIAKLKAEIAGLKQELSEYKSVRSKLRAAELERENTELRGKVRSYEDVIQRNNLWRFFHPHREKAVTRDEAR